MSACACPGVCGSELAAAALRRQRAEELQGEQRAGSSAEDRHGKRSTCLCVAWPEVVHFQSFTIFLTFFLYGESPRNCRLCFNNSAR